MKYPSLVTGLLLQLTVTAIIVASASSALAQRANGFDLSNATIPTSEIRSGGPGKDGIRSIDRPKFVKPSQAKFLRDDDLVVSVTVGNTTRAYPLRILVWHEIVNDTISGQPVAVTYCPLCGTAMVFDPMIGGRRLTFGVSGLLYQSDVLMYDRQTQSLWSQLAMKAVAGKLVDTPLPWLASEHLTWAAWQERYPGGQVLSEATGEGRDYSRQAYPGYERQEKTMFPVPQYRSELRNKEWVAGIIVNGQAAAYPLAGLARSGEAEQEVGGVTVRVLFDPESKAVSVVNTLSGEPVPFVKVYWFAWQAFYPDTALWKP
ncbi:MAG: DUF3179 domain-containing protein [Verrucomicrobia subdivision 3 bacterium]|nr:DUF3179 domain-containing protein [Limisphaerales bacterium]